MYIEIDTKNNQLGYELLNKKIVDGVSLAKGESVEFDGVSVTYDGTIIRKAVDFPSTVQLVIAFASGVTASYVGTWLYNKVHGKAEKITIDKIEVEIDKGEITKVIETHMKKE